ncbi:MAG: bifunctional oligoribonuclease/PAP phosphatase NrnA [Anaerolineae bacterium]|nr:bifunctional oligoribonuclease/PAP phosphatase NrnA [Anaerolineae bacterium]
MWQKIIPLIEQHSAFVLTSHLNPDCDALGSELALAEHLASLGKKVTIINTDPVPEAFQFLDLQRVIKKYSPNKHNALIKKAEAIIVLDASGGWKRLGRVGDALAQANALKVCIDHHPDATDFVDVAAIDTEAAATAELVYELVTAMCGKISAHMAQALYAAIVTDTGNFRFPKTSPRTHRITGELLRAGAEPYAIYRQLYEQYPLARVRLKGHVLDSIKTAAQGRIAYYGLDQATLKTYGVKASELDGFASLGQEIGGVRVVVFCLQSSKSKVKISLRSDGSIAINQLAVAYGGGGHTSAAGATVTGNLAEIMAEVVEKVELLLEAEESANKS